MKRTIVWTLAAMVLVAILAPSTAIAGSDEKTLPANANVGNVAPEITNVFISDNTVDPWSYVDIYTEIEDNNTLADISWVQITVFENSSTWGAADSERSHYKFLFTAPSTWEEIGPDAAGDSHINVGACVAATTTNTKDNYKFDIRLAKIADSDHAWDVTIEVHNGTDSDNENNASVFTVNQYIEQTLGLSSVSWASINPGATNQACDNFPATTTVISNDTWALQLEMENATWKSGANSFNVNNGKFDSDNNVSGATTFSTEYQNLYTTQSYTTSSGVSKSMYFWLSVPGGQTTGNYTNNIKVKVLHE